MGRIGPRPLTNAELKVIGELLEKYISSEVRQRELGTLAGLPRFKKALGISIRDGGGRGRWPQERQLDEMIGTLPEDDARDLMPSPVDERRHRFVAMMARGLGQQLAEEIRSVLPNENQLEETFSKLDGARRDEIMRLPAEETRRVLTQRYLETHTDPKIRQLNEARKELQEMIGRPFPGGNRRPPGDPRPEPPPGSPQGRFGPPQPSGPPPDDRDRPPR